MVSSDNRGSERLRFWKNYDWAFFGTIVVLAIIGLMTLYSSTYLTRIEIFYKQLIFYAVGFGILLVVSLLDYRIFERLAYPFYAVSVFLLALVPIIGKKAQGSQRWLEFGPINFQPSEIIKFAIVLALARFYSHHKTTPPGGYGLRDLMPVFLLLGVPMSLVFFQPDLGTTLMIGFIAFTVIFLCHLKLKTLFMMIGLTILAAPLAYNFVLRDYQRDRVKTFLNPQRDPLGEGYHSIQSMIAVGSGQVFGKGYQAGTQSKLEFLPKHHTDFIFSAFAEEWGFIGCITVLGLFALMIFLGTDIVRKSKDKFGAILAMGSLALIVWHIIINIGMELGILPVVGVTLPFFSYGGSSLITTLLACGIILSVSVRRHIF